MVTAEQIRETFLKHLKDPNQIVANVYNIINNKDEDIICF